MISIYSITNAVNGKKYIGQTIHPERRQRQHLKAWSRCLALNEAVRKHGVAAFEFKVFAINLSREEANAAERHLIGALGTMAPGVYNLTEGGEGGLPSAESRRKISASKKGKPMPIACVEARIRSRTGKPLSAATRAKLSVARERWHSDPENKKRHSEAVKAGMSRHRIQEVHRTP